MASGGAPSGLRQRQVVPELPAGADADGPSLSSAHDRAWMPSSHSGGCGRRARRRWLRQCLRDPLGIPTDAILARNRDSGATGTKNALVEPPAMAWNGFVTTYAVTCGGRRRLIWMTAEELE